MVFLDIFNLTAASLQEVDLDLVSVSILVKYTFLLLLKRLILAVPLLNLDLNSSVNCFEFNSFKCFFNLNFLFRCYNSIFHFFSK
jgi:hypothetical protein